MLLLGTTTGLLSARCAGFCAVLSAPIRIDLVDGEFWDHLTKDVTAERVAECHCADDMP